ncbi:hypothetical protein SOVF_207370, partial [Spinacia oleracea]
DKYNSNSGVNYQDEQIPCPQSDFTLTWIELLNSHAILINELLEPLKSENKV